LKFPVRRVWLLGRQGRTLLDAGSDEIHELALHDDIAS